MVCAQPEICPRKKRRTKLFGALRYKHHVTTARRQDLVIVNKSKKTCQIVDIAVPSDHRVKLKEIE